MKPDFKLCFVRGFKAYFTTQDVTEQWGDDWDDVPYEHNAGEPYEPGMFNYADGRREKNPRDWNEDGTPKWEILVLRYDEAFGKEFSEPSTGCAFNSDWSVRMVNRKETSWLASHDGGTELYAGASVADFVKAINQYGGTVWTILLP